MTSLASITLPDDIIWTDEFDWVPVVQNFSRTAGGKAVVEHGELSGGRPITLNCHWLSKATLDALIVLRDTPGATAVLTLPDARTFNVMFRVHEANAIKAEPVIELPSYITDDRFDVNLKLMEI